MNKTPILIIEDNEDIQLLLTKFLKKLNIPSNSAFNGKDAISAVLKNNYNPILMDINLPDMNGVEVAKEVMKIKQNSATIIAISAETNENIKKECFDAGVSHFIKKPINLNELQNVIFPNLLGKKYVDTNDQELLESIIDIYLAKSPQLIKNIYLNAKNKNYEELKKNSHSLKNSTGHFEAKILYDHLQNIEEATETKDISKIMSILDELENEYTITINKMKVIKKL